VVWAGPDQVDGLAWAGFDVMSFANNHHLDAGYDAFLATMDHLGAHGIATCGAGKDLAAAREPAVVERGGTRVAFLGYSAILFHGYEAGPDKPGCVPLRVATQYAMAEVEQPGCAARVHTYVEHTSLDMLREDVARARERADVVVVTPHWGLHFTPVVVADYESEWAHAS
jgi:poly-gamma-glutamate synthesis protein (capsule biosynthesis protein)